MRFYPLAGSSTEASKSHPERPKAFTIWPYAQAACIDFITRQKQKKRLPSGRPVTEIFTEEQRVHENIILSHFVLMECKKKHLPFIIPLFFKCV